MRHPRVLRATLVGAVLLPLALAACGGPMSARSSSGAQSSVGAGASTDASSRSTQPTGADDATPPSTGDSTMALPPIMIDVPATDGGLTSTQVVAAGLKDGIVFAVPEGTEATFAAAVSDPSVVTFTPGGDQGGWTARPGLVVKAPGTTDVVLTRDGATVIALTVTVLDQPHAGMQGDVSLDPSLPDLSVAPETQALADSLPGMAETDAVAAIEKAGLTLRITARDGENFPMTMDYRPTRINVEIVDGTVTSANIG